MPGTARNTRKVDRHYDRLICTFEVFHLSKKSAKLPQNGVSWLELLNHLTSRSCLILSFCLSPPVSSSLYLFCLVHLRLLPAHILSDSSFKYLLHIVQSIISSTPYLTMSFYSEMRVYAAILSIRPMMETMGMAGGAVDHINSLLESGTDLATESMQRLPTKMLETYYHFRDEDYGSVDALLDHLHDLHAQFYDCYTYIILLYSILPHDGSRPIVNSRNTSVLNHRYPELRSNTPPYILELYPRLLHGLEAVERKIDAIRDAKQRYKLNLSILYQQFQNKVTSNDIGMDNSHDMDQDVVVDASRELAKMVGSKRTPFQTNPRYLLDIARLWRTFGGKNDRIPLQPVYEWVAGSSLTVEEQSRTY